jgi:hypothetical protein
MSPITMQQFQDVIRERLPEVADIVDAHVMEWGDGNMNYILGSMILEHIIEESKKDLKSAELDSPLRRMFGLAEYLMANGDDNVRSCAEIEFVEGLAQTEYIDMGLPRLLGPLGQISWMRLRNHRDTRGL